MRIGIDIDNTITSYPVLFVLLSGAVRKSGGKVFIISSREDSEVVRKLTKIELDGLGITYDELHLLPDKSIAKNECPHKDLDWYQKYVWQKVNYCVCNNIEVYFDDEEKVVELFKRYAPNVKVLKFC